MYIKFCRSYEGDKKNELTANMSPDSKLCVLLEGEKGALDRFHGLHCCVALTTFFCLLSHSKRRKKRQPGTHECTEWCVWSSRSSAWSCWWPSSSSAPKVSMDHGMERVCLAAAAVFLSSTPPTFPSRFQYQPNWRSARAPALFLQPAPSRPARRSTTLKVSSRKNELHAECLQLEKNTPKSLKETESQSWEGVGACSLV